MSIPDWAFDDDDFEDEDDDDWTDLMCSMGPDGQCGQAGSEYCEFSCPHRDTDPPRTRATVCPQILKVRSRERTQKAA